MKTGLSPLTLADYLPETVIFCFIIGSEKVYECDLVLLAMGFLGPEKGIIDELGLKQDERGNISTPRGKYSSSMGKVYAAGGRLHSHMASSSIRLECL